MPKVSPPRPGPFPPVKKPIVVPARLAKDDVYVPLVKKPTFGLTAPKKTLPGQPSMGDLAAMSAVIEPGAYAPPKPRLGPFPLSRAEQAVVGTPAEGMVRDIVNFGSTYGPVVGPTVAQQYLPTEPLGGTGGAGGGGGLGAVGGVSGPVVKELKDIQWKSTTFNTGSGSAPSWWAPKIPTDSADAADPRVNFMMTMNSMIPYLSPEDQHNAAAQLYSMDADHFSEYKPEAIQVTVPVTEETALAAAREGTPSGPAINKEYFTSRERARDAINLLSQLREQTVGGNRWQISPAYTLLQQVLGGVEQFGGGGSKGQYGSYADQGRQTRSQQLAMMGALDPLLAQSKSAEAGGFGAIAQLLSQPFFSQGQLNPTYAGPGGRVLFGRPNQVLF